MFHKLHVYKQLYTCIYTHLNKFNQLVIVISYLYSDCLLLVLRLSLTCTQIVSYLYSDCLIDVCIIMYLFCNIYHITLSTKCLNHIIIYAMNAHAQGRTGPGGKGGVPPQAHCLIKFIRIYIDLYIRLSDYMKDNLQC